MGPGVPTMICGMLFLHVRHILGEAFVGFADLTGPLTCVTHNQYVGQILRRFQLL